MDNRVSVILQFGRVNVDTGAKSAVALNQLQLMTGTFKYFVDSA